MYALTHWTLYLYPEWESTNLLKRYVSRIKGKSRTNPRMANEKSCEPNATEQKKLASRSSFPYKSGQKTRYLMDSEELARIVHLCKTNPRHVGWMQNAMDKNKCGLPTTESQGKCLSGVHRIQQKLTGVKLFNDDIMLLFRTLLDVSTGGNLTLTIIEHMFQREDVQQATDLYINVDGASDNICYHVLYGLAFLLRSANKAGWPMCRIHLLQFKLNNIVMLLSSSFSL